MTPFEHALQLVAGVELDPALAPLQPRYPQDLGPGWLDKRVILQDRIWINRQTRVFPLERMTPLYRSNVIRFLRNEEPFWQLTATTWLALETALDLRHPETVRTRGQALGLLTPGWTTRTPLVRRLLDLNARSLVP